MKAEARKLAEESWDATQKLGLLYADIALSSEFRQTLDQAAHEALTSGTRSGIAGLEAFDDEVQRRLKDVAEVPTAEQTTSDDARTLAKSQPGPEDDVKVSGAAKRLSKKSKRGGK